MRSIILLLTATIMLSACFGGSKKNNADAETITEETPVVEQKETIKDHPGQAVYTTYCLPCHQADGKGVPGMYPTLHDTKWVNGDKETLISIVLHGMDEEIEVNGEIFTMIMSPLPHLTDQQVADVLSYVRKRFGSEQSEVTVEEVKEVRENG